MNDARHLLHLALCGALFFEIAATAQVGGGLDVAKPGEEGTRAFRQCDHSHERLFARASHQTLYTWNSQPKHDETTREKRRNPAAKSRWKK